MALHVAVIGAGVVGACTALELVRDGHRVTLLDPGAPGGDQSASYGNAGWLSPGSIIPMSTPGLWKKVPGYLADPQGPFTIRLAHLPRLLPWLIRFMRSGDSVAKVERTARLLRSLLADCPALHVALAAEIGRPDLVAQQGLLFAYPSRADFEAEALSWRLRRQNGVGWRELGAEEMAARAPELARRYTFGALVETGGHCLDPGGFTAAVAAHAASLGAEIRQAAATGFVIEAGRLKAVATDAGAIACDRAVIAAGIRAKALAALAGNAVPLESERGYHVVLGAEGTPATPVMPMDGKMGNTPTHAGFRASGQVELASVDAPPDWRRADILIAHARAAYPGLAVAPETVKRWFGHRPSTPDGLPVIGPASASSDIWHAFGHGHIGLSAGPKTGRIVADGIAGRAAEVELAAFSAQRF